MLAYGQTLEEIAVEWRQIDTRKVVVEKLVRQGAGSSNRVLNLTQWVLLAKSLRANSASAGECGL